MKLNADCVRDILLTVESAATLDEGFEYDPDAVQDERLAVYSSDEVLYHLRQCDLAGYFYKCTTDNAGCVDIEDLTPRGHEMLADIRSNNVWAKTKSIAEKLGVASLRGLADIAAKVISQIIISEFHI